MVGPTYQVDTACSASLVAANMCHAGLRKNGCNGSKMALMMGLQHILTPFIFVGLTAAGMLGRTGRSLTFNTSANGYNRGEGCGGLFLKVSSDSSDIQDTL